MTILFNNLIHSNKYILLEFYAPWCSKCREMESVLQQAANHWHQTISVYKINIEKNKDLAGELAIMSIPTLLLFENGNEVMNKVGKVSTKKLNTLLSHRIKV